MNNLNSVLVEGNLTREPSLGETPKGTPVCTFGLAVNRFYRQDDSTVKEVSFFDVETWTRVAQYCSAQLKKGSAVRVVGHLKQERWEDSEGKPHTRVKIVGEHIELTEKQPRGEAAAPGAETEKEVLEGQAFSDLPVSAEAMEAEELVALI